MCVSVDLATFRATILIATQAIHPETGRTIHTLIYRNAPENRSTSGGGNAMLLHFPAAEPMDSANVIDTSRFPHCAEDIRNALPQPRGQGALRTAPVGEALVFEHGIYHVVLARNSTSISKALNRVPDHKRPQLNFALFDWYGEAFPEYTLALCCFDNEDAALADPLLWWYHPLRPDWLMMPAVDAHDGSAPDLEARVDTDHFVAIGSQQPAPHLHEVRYRDQIPKEARPYLPRYVDGANYVQPMRNADFIASVEALQSNTSDPIRRGFLPL